MLALGKRGIRNLGLGAETIAKEKAIKTHARRCNANVCISLLQTGTEKGRTATHYRRHDASLLTLARVSIFVRDALALFGLLRWGTATLGRVCVQLCAYACAGVAQSRTVVLLAAGRGRGRGRSRSRKSRALAGRRNSGREKEAGEGLRRGVDPFFFFFSLTGLATRNTFGRRQDVVAG